MGIHSYRAGAFALGIALTAIVPQTSEAQADTTRTDSTRQAQDTVIRARSTRRIPVRKDFTTRTSAGEVMLNEANARMDSLAAAAAADRARLDSISAAAAAAAAKADENARNLTMVQDSLRAVHGELTTVNAKAAALSDSVNRLGTDIRQLRGRLANGSIFGHSGFYVGLGSGANFTSGTLRNIGYQEGLNISVPIGWNKPGTMLGIRGNLGVQTFDGISFGSFNNKDPEIWTAEAMLALHFPFNQAKTSNVFIDGGGGVYRFKDFGTTSTLASRLDNGFTGGTISSSSKTKFGVTGGAGVEFHILGATSLFVESRFTNVFVDASTQGGDNGKNLHWVPVVLGFQIR